MPYNVPCSTNSSPIKAYYNPYRYAGSPKMIYKFPKRYYPPVIFIDNKNGYVPINNKLGVRAGESLSWSNAKYCMGFTFYANDEEIGAGIVVGGEIYSIASYRLEDFFNRDFGTDVERAEASIVEAIQLDYEHIYLAAILMYNGEVVFASKMVNARGLSIATRTKIKSTYIDKDTINREKSYFNSYGESTIDEIYVGWDDMIVTYEKYKGARGFGDLSISVIGERGDNIMIDVYRKIIDDINSQTTMFINIDGCIDIESAQYDEKVFILFLTTSGVRVVVFDGFEYSTHENAIEFEEKSCQNVFDNVYEGRIFVVPPKDIADQNIYSKIFSPAGVFYRYSRFQGFVIVLPYGNLTMKGYRIKHLGDDGRNTLDVLAAMNGDSEDIVYITHTSSRRTEQECDKMTYILDGDAIMMNTPRYDYFLASYYGTRAYVSLLGEGSKAVRSMSLYMPYLQQE